MYLVYSSQRVKTNNVIKLKTSKKILFSLIKAEVSA